MVRTSIRKKRKDSEDDHKNVDRDGEGEYEDESDTQQKDACCVTSHWIPGHFELTLKSDEESCADEGDYHS